VRPVRSWGAHPHQLAVLLVRNRQGHRDATMILLAYRHGLRAAEVVDLRWEQVDFNAATLHVRRVKQGTPATHPLRGDELRALRRLRCDSPESPSCSFPSADHVERAGKAAALPFGCHPHMLRRTVCWMFLCPR
jgi:integrase